MVSRYKNFNKVWDKDTANERKLFLSQKTKNAIKNYNYYLYVIPLKERYRPDLLAEKIYGSFKYHWILTYANNFFNSPGDYEIDRIIKVPDPSVIDIL